MQYRLTFFNSCDHRPGILFIFAGMKAEKNPIPIYLAPLQEYTDAVYRNAHFRLFGGVDKYFAPYLVLQNDGSVKKSTWRDILPENNPDVLPIPQILAGTTDEFVSLANKIKELGYQEMNWNLGCPYPMVTRRGRGAGLLPHPDKIREILENAFAIPEITVSVKLRAGLESKDELLPVLQVLNDFPVTEIILHPRIAKDLYKGEADRNLFTEAKEICQRPLIYNGDILTADDARDYASREDVSTLMIGRGILQNPFLASEINGTSTATEKEKVQLLRDFHSEIYSAYAEKLSGFSHQQMRMIKFWSYFSESFPEPRKAFKKVKKATSEAKYDEAVSQAFRQFEL